MYEIIIKKIDQVSSLQLVQLSTSNFLITFTYPFLDYYHHHTSLTSLPFCSPPFSPNWFPKNQSLIWKLALQAYQKGNMRAFKWGYLPHISFLLWSIISGWVNTHVTGNFSTLEPQSHKSSPGLINSTLLEARTSCVKRPLNAQLWQELELNDYLKGYTGGSTLTLNVSSIMIFLIFLDGSLGSKIWEFDQVHSMSYILLQAYANQMNVTNLACGIGRSCDVGQVRLLFYFFITRRASQSRWTDKKCLMISSTQSTLISQAMHWSTSTSLVCIGSHSKLEWFDEFDLFINFICVSWSGSTSNLKLQF